MLQSECCGHPAYVFVQPATATILNRAAVNKKLGAPSAVGRAQAKDIRKELAGWSVLTNTTHAGAISTRLMLSMLVDHVGLLSRATGDVTDPLDTDTDDDGMPDGSEIADGTDPNDPEDFVEPLNALSQASLLAWITALMATTPAPLRE